jgi:pimeloyl-ACP methyl ester carboxylesterase
LALGVATLGIVGPGAIASPGEAQASVSGSNSVYADAPFRVDFSVASVGANPIVDPAASPAGANNWSCKPSALHPDPVVLVHGLGATMAENWSTMAPLLADNGYCVFALTYGLNPGEDYVGGLQPMEISSQQLASFVDRILASTGAAKVDLVGHSEGTVMPQYYLKFLGGAAKVNRYVALAPLYQGTTLYGLAAGIKRPGEGLPAPGRRARISGGPWVWVMRVVPSRLGLPRASLRQRGLRRARGDVHDDHDPLRRIGHPLHLG